MPKIRIREGESKVFFLDSRGRVRKPLGRPRADRFCDGCGVDMQKRAGHVCVACWAECKTFRKYLREVLGFEPIKDDAPPNPHLVVNHRFRTFAERVHPGRVDVRMGAR